MIIVTSNFIAGKKVTKTLGLVKGNTVRTRFFLKDILAHLKNLVGGEVEEYTKLLAESREQAVDRMIANAKALGGNAIINAKFSTSEIMNDAAEIMVYGTAVVVEDE